MRVFKFLMAAFCLSFCLSSCNEDEEELNDGSKNEQGSKEDGDLSGNGQKKINSVVSYSKDNEYKSRIDYKYDGDSYSMLYYDADSKLYSKTEFIVSSNKTTQKNYQVVDGVETLQSSIVDEYGSDKKLAKRTYYDASGVSATADVYKYNGDTTRIELWIQGSVLNSVTEIILSGNTETKCVYLANQDNALYSKTVTEYTSDKKVKSIYEYDAKGKEKEHTIYTYVGNTYDYINYKADGSPYFKYEYTEEDGKLTTKFYYGEGQDLILSTISITEYLK